MLQEMAVDIRIDLVRGFIGINCQPNCWLRVLRTAAGLNTVSRPIQKDTAKNRMHIFEVIIACSQEK